MTLFYTRLVNNRFIKEYALFVVGVLYFLFIFFKNAWVADDAYIAFRSVEQLFAGNGPRWNFDERVQVYTSPLWFILLCLGRLVMTDLFLISILLSALCCVGILVIVRKAIGDNRRWLLFVLLISGAWSVMDFTSSGLENPLLFFLIAVYLWCYGKFFSEAALPGKKKSLTGLLLSIGLLSITRHDVATLILIPSMFVFFRAWKLFGFSLLVKKSYLILLPFFLWTAFSVIYYGVPFPNTAYAKILHGIPRADLIDFGRLYLWVSIRWDVFVQVSFIGLVVVVFWQKSLPALFILSGILLNLFYAVYVGGDFMQGRFISTSVFMAAFFACTAAPFSKKAVMACAVILLGMTAYCHVPLKQPAEDGFDITEGKRHFSWHGILNERNFYFKTNSLWAWWHRDKSKPFPHHKWCVMGQRASANDKQVSDFGGIGMYGYCAGLNLIVIDRLALGEPFLARLPKPLETEWRAGHFRRDYPRGFYESRVSGENHLVDSHLAALWRDVALLTRAPFFTMERWHAIWRLNTGFYKDIAPYYFADIAEKNS